MLFDISAIYPLFAFFIQYGKDYEFDAPAKLLDKFLHAMAQSVDEQVVVISQVLSLSLSLVPCPYFPFCFFLQYYAMFYFMWNLIILIYKSAL